jgi:hypothetical protein
VSEKQSEESDDVILVQLDEVTTKSQEKDRKMNLTYTGTVEDGSGITTMQTSRHELDGIRRLGRCNLRRKYQTKISRQANDSHQFMNTWKSPSVHKLVDKIEKLERR